MCVDPITGATAVATVVSAGSQIAQGVGQNRLAKEQAAYTTEQGRQQLVTATREEAAFRRQTERSLARQRLQLLASGVDVGSGSAAEIAAEDARLAELDALRIRYGGEVAYSGAQQESRFIRRGGRAAQTYGFLNAGATVLSQADTWNAFRKTKPPAPTRPQPPAPTRTG